MLLHSHEDGLLKLLWDRVRYWHTVFGLRHELHGQEKLRLRERVLTLRVDELPNLGAHLSGKLGLRNNFLHFLIRHTVRHIFIKMLENPVETT